jgi:hypothetical protein
MTAPFKTVHDILLSGFEVGSTSKEASSKKLTEEATQAETNLEGEQYYQATHLMSLFGYKAPSGVTPPKTLKDAISDVENGETLYGWYAPSSAPTPSSTPEPSTFTIPWWVYVVLGVIVIGLVIALVR